MEFGLWFSLLYFNKHSFPQVFIFQASLVVQPWEATCQEEIRREKKLPENKGWRDLACRGDSINSPLHCPGEPFALVYVNDSLEFGEVRLIKYTLKYKGHGKTSVMKIGREHFCCLSKPCLVKWVQKVSCGSREERMVWTEAVKKERKDKKGKWRLEAGSPFRSTRAKDWMKIAKERKKMLWTGDGNKPFPSLMWVVHVIC